ncbi:MAG TPA: ATP-binding protein [Paucimonas sp.]|nr:ATP-binding protein [Paucimonas sp.]
MRIVTSMHLALAGVAATVVGFAFAALTFQNAQRDSVEQRQLLYRVVQGVAELHIRTDEYMDRSRFDIRPLRQWQIRDAVIAKDLRKIRRDTPEARQLAQSLTARHEEIRHLFRKLVGLRTAADNDALAHLQQERLLGRLFVMFEEQFAEADELRRLADASDQAALVRAVILGAVTLALMSASVLLCAAIIRRNLSAPLRRLLDATEAIGSGQLEHRIGSPADDEIGALSRAFDTMAERLQHVTASRDEVLRAKAALRRLNETLEERVATRTAALERMHEQLHQAQKMEAVGQLTGGIAHDFNNLLASIVGNLEMMRVRMAQGRGAELPRYVDAIMAVTERATALTHRLLAFSRRQTLDPRPVDVHALVTSMQELIQRSVGPAIHIETAVLDRRCITLCDANQLESAVLNLAINARDAMPKGGRLTIDVTHACFIANDDEENGVAAGDQPRDHILIGIADTGVGMSSDTLARVFDPFFTTKPLGQGTGLGLSMVYGFVKQSGGHIHIDSRPGLGTTVQLYLPCYRGDLEPAQHEAAPAAVPRADRTANVLVVDDEPEVRKTAIEMLEELGYSTISVASGTDCLRMLESRRIDLLITDVGLPGDMDGWKVADKARKLQPDLKVLFITGYVQHMTSQRPLEPGMEILTKPFGMDAFAVKVRNLMANAPLSAHCPS